MATVYSPDDEPHLEKLRLVGAHNKRLVIFVHGALSGYLKQWHGFHTTLKNHAGHDTVLCEWNFLFLGYDWTSIKSYSAIADLIAEECRRAASGHFGYHEKHEAVAFVGFSLGTLGIREYLANCALQPTGMTVKKAILYGSPVLGSFYASLASEIAPGTILDQLTLTAPALAMLRNWSACAFASHPWQPNIVYAGVKDGIVHTNTAAFGPWVTDQIPVRMTNTGHSIKSLAYDANNSDLFRTLAAELR